MRTNITEEEGIHKEWYKEADDNMTVEKLPAFLKKLTEDYNHDYGTICHAITAAALAAAHAVDHSEQGGITGFQASCIMWEFLKEWNHLQGPARLLNYEQALYPQYDYVFTAISKDTWEWLQTKAKERLEEAGERAHPNVLAHWKSIVAGVVPFGLRIEKTEE